MVRGGGGDYLREAIILTILVKGGQLSEGQLLFEEMWYYMSSNMAAKVFILLINWQHTCSIAFISIATHWFYLQRLSCCNVRVSDFMSCSHPSFELHV